MIFNSVQFLLFFPLVVFFYFLLPFRFRWTWLLFASCVFYMACIPEYILVLVVIILVDYKAGILIGNSQGHRRKMILMFSITANLSILLIFKYLDFFSGSVNFFTKLFGWGAPLPLLHIVLPLGISFHTFQSMSYTIEIYRGNQKPEKNLGRFALYVMFFPQLVAGPIERPGNLLPQIYEERGFDSTRAVEGLRMMLFGFFMKVVIADHLAVYVDAVYGHHIGPAPMSILIATYFFAFQIYCDFAGYSYIAIGSAHIMGFSLMQNFRWPYFSESIPDFWKRWHISLSTWFRDYVYVPLGGNREGTSTMHRNIMVVFILSGLWHGASLGFLAWGLYHGLLFIAAIVLARLPWVPSVSRPVKVFLTFHCVLIGWVFFRAGSLTPALFFLEQLINFYSLKITFPENYGVGSVLMGGALILFLLLVELFEKRGFAMEFQHRPLVFRWFAYSFLMWAILFSVAFRQQISSQFIYFQF